MGVEPPWLNFVMFNGSTHVQCVSAGAGTGGKEKRKSNEKIKLHSIIINGASDGKGDSKLTSFCEYGV